MNFANKKFKFEIPNIYNIMVLRYQDKKILVFDQDSIPVIVASQKLWIVFLENPSMNPKVFQNLKWLYFLNMYEDKFAAEIVPSKLWNLRIGKKKHGIVFLNITWFNF